MPYIIAYRPWIVNEKLESRENPDRVVGSTEN